MTMARVIQALLGFVVMLGASASYAATCFVGGGKYYSDFAVAAQKAAQASCTQRMVGTATIVQLYPPPYAYGTGATFKCSGEPTTERFVDVGSSSMPSCSGDADEVTCVAGIQGASSGDNAGSYCSAGCVVQATTIVTPKGSRSVWMTSGEKCTSEPAAPPSAPPPVASGASAPGGTGPCPGGADVCPPDSKTKSCPKGTFATDVGGSALCVSMKPVGTEAPKTNQTTGGVSSTGTTTKTTTTKTTTNADGSTTTTETTNETSSGTESRPNDIASFCSENPESQLCGDTGSWSGGCTGGFTCGGDAVQCAQAQAAWKLACQMDTDPNSATSKLGAQAANGVNVGGDTSGGSVGLGSFDDSNPYAASCPADIHFSVAGQNMTIPFSTSCSWFQAVGYLFVAGACLMGLQIAFGGAK